MRVKCFTGRATDVEEMSANISAYTDTLEEEGYALYDKTVHLQVQSDKTILPPPIFITVWMKKGYSHV